MAIFSVQRGTSPFLPDEWKGRVLGQPLLRQAVTLFKCRLRDGSRSPLTGQVAQVRMIPAEQPLLYRDGIYDYTGAHVRAGT